VASQPASADGCWQRAAQRPHPVEMKSSEGGTFIAGGSRNATKCCFVPTTTLISHLESENWDDKAVTLEKSLPVSITSTATPLRKAAAALL